MNVSSPILSGIRLAATWFMLLLPCRTTTWAQEPIDSADECLPEVVPAMWQPTPLVEPRIYGQPATQTQSFVGSGARAGTDVNIQRHLAPSASVSSPPAFAPRDRVTGAEALPRQQPTSVTYSRNRLRRRAFKYKRRRRSYMIRACVARALALWLQRFALDTGSSRLDTIVSKFDSRQMHTSTTITAGPYIALGSRF